MGIGERDAIARVAEVAAEAVAVVDEEAGAPGKERAHAARREHAERQRHFAPRLLDANHVMQRVDAGFGRRRIRRRKRVARIRRQHVGRRAEADVVEHVDAHVHAHRLADLERRLEPHTHVGAGKGVVVAARRRRREDRLSRRRGRPARQIEIVPHVAAHAQVAAEREPEVVPRRRRHRQHVQRRLVGRLLGGARATRQRADDEA